MNMTLLEQEEVVRNLREKSQKRNSQYLIILQILVGLSATL